MNWCWEKDGDGSSGVSSRENRVLRKETPLPVYWYAESVFNAWCLVAFPLSDSSFFQSFQSFNFLICQSSNSCGPKKIISSPEHLSSQTFLKHLLL